MGFYGNITNINNSTFVFDRIYSNRQAMDQGAREGDAVLIGRYVLIEYDEDPKTYFSQAYRKEGIFYLSPQCEEVTKILYAAPIEYSELKSKAYYVTKDDLIYLENNGTIEYYKCTGGNNNVPIFSLVLNLANEEVKDNETFLINYLLDQKAYKDKGGVGRGYDSTVWQKTYTENGEKYVMIAELNSVVPTFDLTVDAPTMTPIVPHFDADSTNVNYRLHVQPQWGFKVAHADPTKDDYVSTAGTFPSDEKAKYTKYKYDINSGITTDQTKEYQAAIYYNKEGFKKNTRHYDTVNQDKISISPTGTSGEKYNTHNKTNPQETRAQIDTQELSIILPSLGNTISDVWDLIYGQKRNQDIKWNSTAGLRLIHENEDGFSYSVNELETLAGCLNSVHDLMGMIVKEETADYDATNADGDKIYYGEFKEDLGKRYYIKEENYQYVPFTEEEWQEYVEGRNGVGLIQFEKNVYHTQSSNGFNLVTVNKFDKLNSYYLLDFEEVELDGSYEPNKYYYAVYDENKNFLGYYKDTADNPNEDVQYYDVAFAATIGPDTNTNTYFYYLPNFVEKTLDENNEWVGGKIGLFYDLENGDAVHVREDALLDTELNTKEKGYYYVENYTVTSSGGPEGSQKVFDFDAQGAENKKVYIKFVEFDETKEYYKLNENKDYEYIKSLEQIDRKTNYGEVELTMRNKFWEKGLYYYSNNSYDANEYLFNGEYYNKNYDFIFSDGDNEKFDAQKRYFLLYGTESSITNLNENSKLKNITLNLATFKNKLGWKNYNTYTFTFTENGWLLSNDNNIYGDITNFGISYNGIPEEGDILQVIYAQKEFSIVQNAFYEPNKYYYKDNYSIDRIDKEEVMTPKREYFLKQFAYVIEDESGILDKGAEWNNNVLTIPEGIVLGRRLNAVEDENNPDFQQYVWKELEGFGRNLNTIHGLIIEINRLLNTNNRYSRDSLTVQGCINLMNDIINTFGTLIPGELLIVDEYGRIASSGYSSSQDVTGQRYNYNYESAEFEFESIDNVKAEGEKEEGWIGLDINPDSINHKIGFTHKYNPIEAEIQKTDMNTVGDVFGVLKPVIDNAGHTIALDTENIKLPNGYKTITTGETSAIAQNSKDNVEVLTDEWLSAIASTNEEGISQLVFNHKYPKEVEDTTSESDVNDNGDSIVLETINLDDKGHVINKVQNTVTLPFGYKTFTDGVNHSIASNTQDSFTFNGDTWIQPVISQNKIDISHIGPQSDTIPDDSTFDLAFGDEFVIYDSYYDSKGHNYGTASRTFTIPTGSLEDVVFNNADVITQLSFEPTTGKITTSRTNINELQLTNYLKGEDGTQISATDTVGQAFSKLENQIDNLNNKTNENIEVLSIELDTIEDNLDTFRKTYDDFIRQNYMVLEDEYIKFVNDTNGTFEDINENINLLIKSDQKTSQDFIDLQDYLKQIENNFDRTIQDKTNEIYQALDDLSKDNQDYQSVVEGQIEQINDKIVANQEDIDTIFDTMALGADLNKANQRIEELNQIIETLITRIEALESSIEEPEIEEPIPEPENPEEPNPDITEE